MELVLSVLLMLVVLTVGVAVAGGVAWLTTTLARRWDRRADAARRSGYPACGRCGYRCAGWSTTRCPECGTDRSRVPPREVRPTSWRGELVLLLPGVATLAALVAGLGLIAWWMG